MNAIPTSWTLARVADMTSVVRGASPRPKGDPKYFGGNIPWISIKDVNSEPGKFLTKTSEGVTPDGAAKSRLLEKGTLILSNSGSVCIPKILGVPGCIHDGFVAFPGWESKVNISFFYYAFEWLRPRVMEQHRQGVTQVNLNIEIVRALEIPVAPIAEQTRIADKLDAIHKRVEAVNAHLARVALILKRFRQSVLAAATSGRLTEDWRNDSHPDVGDIPLNWERTTLRHCITSMTGGASPSVEHYAPAGVLALNKGDIKLYGRLAEKQDQKRVPREFAELHRTKLVQKGDLLVTLRDLSNKADFLGLIAQFMGTEVALPTQGMYALFVAENTLPKFLMYFSNSPIYREVMKREKVGATQVHLRNDQFLDIPIALPPVKEQAEIVRRLETLFAFADRLEARLRTAQTATERLTPALLAKAFRGELVPQDPNDEPASELLKRLASSTATTVTKKRGRPKSAT